MIMMNKYTYRYARRLLGLVMAVLLAVNLRPLSATAAGGVSRDSTSRAIAIVFDNSGSMYSSGKKAWCQATYAIEVFASMMNDGDVLLVYPMNDIQINGAGYSSSSPLVIDDTADASVIQQIYTPVGGDTPIEPITAARDGLLQTDADDKWLIVLTDGEVFYEGGVEMTKDETTARLSEMLSEYNRDVNVLYLGIGNLAVPQITGPNAHGGETANSAQVPATLSRMCNQIFGRDELPQQNRSGGQLTFDIPMNKLIVFVQGENVGDVSVTDSSGAPVGQMVSTAAPHYSTLGAGGYSNTADTTLQGMIVTYQDCAAGTYSLNYSGTSSSITAYYEPNVDLAVRLLDEEGNTVTENAGFYPGKYTISYGMIDAEGNFTESSLLGTTNYSITYILNGQEETVVSSTAGDIALELGEGDTLDASAVVTFLKDYEIRRSGSELGWPSGGFSVTQRPIGNLAIRVSGGAGSYGLPELEEKGVYEIGILYEGERLSGEQLDRAAINVSVEGGNAGYELEEGTDSYILRLKYAGSAAETASGEYILHVSASYVNEFDQTAQSGTENLPFTVEEVPSDFTVQLEQPQDFYVISRVEDGEPFTVRLFIEGSPLTEEQMEAASVTAEAGDLSLITERIPGEAAYRIRIDPAGQPGAGRYRLHVTTTMKDDLGRDITAETEGRFELSVFPKWVYAVIGIAGLLLLILLIWLYMNVKKLPRKITVSKTIFVVDGVTVSGNGKCTYSGGKHKRATLEINTPKYTTNPLVKGGFRLDLEAVSPRRVKSAMRAAQVKGIAAVNTGAVTSIKIGNALFVKDAGTNKLTRSGSGAKAPIDFPISTGARCSVVGEVMNGDGGSSSFSLVVTLKYY